MRIHRLFGLLLIGLTIAAGCKKAAPTAPVAPSSGSVTDQAPPYLTHAQPRLPTIKLWLGDQELTTEIASKPVEIYTGMMYRTNLPENEAMLFVLPAPERASFYMHNCEIGLSGAYISPSGEILQIIDMKPHDETPIVATSDNIQFVLEAPHGWFERHDVKTGAVVRTERGSLHDVFLGKQ